MSRPQNSIQTLTRSQNQPIRAQKSKNDPKIKWKSKFEIEEILENELNEAYKMKVAQLY